VPYDRAKFGHIADDAVYLLIGMTARDAGARPSAADVRERLTQIAGGTRLNSLEDLLKHGSVSQYVPASPTPHPPSAIPAFSPAPPMQPTPMHQPMPMHQPTPMHQPMYTPYPTTANNSNKLLWVALGVLAFLILVTGGCMMMFMSAA
jgi:hypothetical protein